MNECFMSPFRACKGMFQDVNRGPFLEVSGLVGLVTVCEINVRHFSG